MFYTIFRFTGLNKDKARFQTLSLMTTSGFTTSESEDILNSPKRRTIAMVAMFFGYMFSVVIASAIINLSRNFEGKTRAMNFVNIVVIVIAIVTLFYISRSQRVNRLLSSFIKHRIENYISRKQKVNPLYVLDNHGKFVMCEVLITNIPEELKGKTLIQAEVRQKYDISVLTIKHGHEIKIIDAVSDVIKQGDRVIVFGDMKKITTLFHSNIL